MDDSDKQKKSAPKLKQFFIRKRLFVIWGAALLITAAAVGVYFLYFNPFNDNSNNQEKVAQVSEAEVAKKHDLYNETDSIVSEEGYQAGQDNLDIELAKTSDPREQAQLYILKASIAGSSSIESDLVKALEYAYKAESLFPSEETALVIASFEDSQNNIPDAIKYYKLFLERFSNNSDRSLYIYRQADYDYYNARVSELEAGI